MNDNTVFPDQPSGVGTARDLQAKNEEYARRVHELEQTLGELRQRMSQLESLTQLRTHLFSNTIHELRTPLVAVSGYAKLILKEQAGQINSTQREYLTAIQENAGKMIELLKDASHLVFEVDLRLESLDIRELWQETLDVIRPQASRKTVELVAHFPSEPCIVTGDREKLELVFCKLLSNAVRFASSGGQIQVDVRKDAKQITSRVSDIGEGIPAELEEKLFGSRRSGDPSPADRQAENMGVSGVSMVHDVIRAHGGRILAQRGPGRGSTVTFTLPLIRLGTHLEVEETNAQAHGASG